MFAGHHCKCSRSHHMPPVEVVITAVGLTTPALASEPASYTETEVEAEDTLRAPPASACIVNTWHQGALKPPLSISR